ncbi:tRNA (adenosine(37)-N6)-threonylcarbamoyltransferase complex ATPase subunit type 1 TsaE [Salinisphaera sp. T31B1]|uniref:tRNA (adenosine(37)-N6)-threonylcarbamoyltransferase complex ATPase subunit type 1 TsaE n=1 Tax=Salinisphaera sp. T31B1 TaxID=727963 RepID=UPI003341D209
MIELADPAATDTLGRRLAATLAQWPEGLVISLVGEVGAGKTALTRAALVALGHTGHVVSPSYTLVEPYRVAQRQIYHLDLYRLADPEELEFLGIREIDAAVDWLFVEWADHGRGFLPPIDLSVQLEYAGHARRAHIQGLTARGQQFADALQYAT